jgi:hypothetical protein
MLKYRPCFIVHPIGSIITKIKINYMVTIESKKWRKTSRSKIKSRNNVSTTPIDMEIKVDDDGAIFVAEKWVGTKWL